MNTSKIEKNDKNLQKFDKRNFYTNDDSGKVFIFAMLLPLILAFCVSMLISISARGDSALLDKITNSSGIAIASSLIAPISFVIIFFVYNKIAGVSYSASTIKNKFRWQDGLICILLGAVLLFGLTGFMGMHDAFLQNILHYELSSLPLPLDNFGWCLLAILLVAVLPAICEELIFRGVVLQGLRKNFSDVTAILLSALMFALMHGSLEQLVYPFIMGAILGWICLRTGSIWGSAIVHFINNALVVILAYCDVNILNFVNVWWFYLLAIGLLILTGVIIFLLDKFYFKRKNQNEIEKDRIKHYSIFVIVGIVIGVILLIVSIITKYLG